MAYGVRNLHAVYHTYLLPSDNWSDIDAQSGPIPAINGGKWNVRLDFEYWDDIGGWFRLGCDLVLAPGELAEGGHQSIYWDVYLWPRIWNQVSYYTPIGDEGTWLTNLGNGKRVDAVKWIEKDGVRVLSDTDREAFYQVALPPAQAILYPDWGEYKVV